MTGKYEKLILSGRAGIFAAPRVIGPLRAAAKRTGVTWFDLDLEGVTSRPAFLKRSALALALPDHFGENWDALHESLIELGATSTPGAVIHWRRGGLFAKRAPEAVDTALEVLREAALYWSGTARVFLVAVDRDGAPGRDLPPLR